MTSIRAILQGAAYYGITPLSSASYGHQCVQPRQLVAAVLQLHACHRCQARVCLPNCRLRELLALLASSPVQHAHVQHADSSAGSFIQLKP
jgi:hypothetical protein